MTKISSLSSNNRGLSFQSYNKNNGINYSQQQSLLQVLESKADIVEERRYSEKASREEIHLKANCKTKSSLSEIYVDSELGGVASNSKTTSFVLDATSSFSPATTVLPLHVTSSRTSCTSGNADKASHDSSRNNSNLGIISSSHEIFLRKTVVDRFLKIKRSRYNSTLKNYLKPSYNTSNNRCSSSKT